MAVYQVGEIAGMAQRQFLGNPRYWPQEGSALAFGGPVRLGSGWMDRTVK